MLLGFPSFENRSQDNFAWEVGKSLRDARFCYDFNLLQNIRKRSFEDGKIVNFVRIGLNLAKIFQSMLDY